MQGYYNIFYYICCMNNKTYKNNMNIKEYLIKYKELENEYKLKQDRLNIKYCLSNNYVNEYDIVKVNNTYFKVLSINSYILQDYEDLVIPILTYNALNLNTNLIEIIYQDEITSINNRVYNFNYKIK